jgi:WD40 repeat protein
VNAVAVSPDGRFIVSGSDDRTVKVWELESGRLLRSLEGHTGGVNAVAVSPDGRFIVSGSSDRTVKVWELESGRLLRSLEGHTVG